MQELRQTLYHVALAGALGRQLQQERTAGYDLIPGGPGHIGDIAMQRRHFLRNDLKKRLAVVFGLVACVTFLLIEPVINNVLNPEKISKVEFPEEKKEVKPQELLTEESVARQEVQRQEAAVEEAKEEAIQMLPQLFRDEGHEGVEQVEQMVEGL